MFRLHRGDTNTRAVLEHLTRDGRYALLQEHLAAKRGEKRVLVAAGTIIGAYRKKLADHGEKLADHRGNLDAGASAHRTTLTEAERETLRRLSAHLDGLGVRFAAVDLIGDRVLEINVANPGWLGTYEAVTGEDLTPMVVAALARWAGRPTTYAARSSSAGLSKTNTPSSKAASASVSRSA